MKNKTWAAIFLAALAVLAGIIAFQRRDTGAHMARVYQDGVCIWSMDLSAVREPYSFTVTDGAGHENRILVEPGRICVEEANCPDQVCVETGWISGGTKPIVCLPAKLVIRLIDGENSIDGVVG